MIPDYFRASLSLSPSLSRTNMHIQHTLTHFTKFSLAVVFQQTTAWEPIGKVPHTPNTAYHAQTCTYSTLLHISTVRISFCGGGWSWSSCKAWNKGALYALLVILYYVVEVADCVPSSSWSFLFCVSDTSSKRMGDTPDKGKLPIPRPPVGAVGRARGRARAVPLTQGSLVLQYAVYSLNTYCRAIGCYSVAWHVHCPTGSANRDDLWST